MRIYTDKVCFRGGTLATFATKQTYIGWFLRSFTRINSVTLSLVALATYLVWLRFPLKVVHADQCPDEAALIFPCWCLHTVESPTTPQSCFTSPSNPSRCTLYACANFEFHISRHLYQIIWSLIYRVVPSYHHPSPVWASICIEWNSAPAFPNIVHWGYEAKQGITLPWYQAKLAY